MPHDTSGSAFSVRRICVVLTVLSGLPSLKSQVSQGAHPELKASVLRQFPYKDDRVEPPASDDSGSAAQDLAPDSNVVVMEKFRVTERLRDRELAADIMKTKPLKAKSVAKFGTGVYQKDFGKVRASAVTILYVPIMLNASW